MSAIEYREYTLLCDGPGCTRQYGPLGFECPRAKLRRMAARDGWTHVRSPRDIKHDDDFCPVHKPGDAR